MKIREVHRGGWFLHIARVERADRLRDLLVQSARTVVLARDAAELESLRRRLALWGVRVATSDACQAGGPTSERVLLCSGQATPKTAIPSDIVVHYQVAPDLSSYAPRITNYPAPLHLSFVVPEDRGDAQTLERAIAAPSNGSSEVETVTELLEVARVNTKNAALPTPKRRFSLSRQAG